MEWLVEAIEWGIQLPEAEFRAEAVALKQQNRLCEKWAPLTISMQQRIWHLLLVVIRELGSAAVGRQLQARGGRMGGRRSEFSILWIRVRYPRPSPSIKFFPLSDSIKAPLIVAVGILVATWVAMLATPLANSDELRCTSAINHPHSGVLHLFAPD